MRQLTSTIINKFEDILLYEVIGIAHDGNFLGIKFSNVRKDVKYLFLTIKTTREWEGGPGMGTEFPIDTNRFEIVTDIRKVPDSVIDKLHITIGIE